MNTHNGVVSNGPGAYFTKGLSQALCHILAYYSQDQSSFGFMKGGLACLINLARTLWISLAPTGFMKGMPP